jgi:hypothetical protein
MRHLAGLGELLLVCQLGEQIDDDDVEKFAGLANCILLTYVDRVSIHDWIFMTFALKKIVPFFFGGPPSIKNKKYQ